MNAIEHCGLRTITGRRYLLPSMVHSAQRYLFPLLVSRIRVLGRRRTTRFGFTQSNRFACGVQIRSIRSLFVSPAQLGRMLDIRSEQVLRLNCHHHAYLAFKFGNHLLKTFHNTPKPPSSPQASRPDRLSSTERSLRLEKPRISTV